MVGGRGEKIHFFDSAHQAGDYGWHIVDDHGLPYAHVFTDPSISAGSDWISGTDAISATVSHEALEMLADPSPVNPRDSPTTRKSVDPGRCRRRNVT